MKKGLNAVTLAGAAVLACIVALVTVLGVRASRNGLAAAERGSPGETEEAQVSTLTAEQEPLSVPPDEVDDSSEEETPYEEEPTTKIDTLSETSKKIPETAPSTAAQKIEAESAGRESTAKKVAETIAKTTEIAIGNTEVEVVVEEDATIPVLNDSDTKKGVAPAASSTPDESLPNDMYFTGLYRMGYDVIGPKEFIYNDDTSPNCTQRKFGYNVLYDAGAKLIDFSIETSRIKFNYDNKEYMVQLWKGQYISGEIGTVGGEIGYYTRPAGTKSAVGHYNCADESDWLYMELTVFWDEDGDGSYEPQLTRKYAKHWWETGYVDGQLKNPKDSSPLRLLQRVTFKDEEQATLFEQALVKAGFRSVSEFNPTVKDTCKRYGKDVIYVWQDVR